MNTPDDTQRAMAALYAAMQGDGDDVTISRETASELLWAASRAVSEGHWVKTPPVYEGHGR